LVLFKVVVPKAKGEILGVVIVESGWGSMLPTVVIANLAPAGAAARCGQLNIGDQIIAINGVSLVGLPLSTCQNYIKVNNIFFEYRASTELKKIIPYVGVYRPTYYECYSIGPTL
jgi:predicted metalloprotease with PDZ domain